MFISSFHFTISFCPLFKNTKADMPYAFSWHTGPVYSTHYIPSIHYRCHSGANWLGHHTRPSIFSSCNLPSKLVICFPQIPHETHHMGSHICVHQSPMGSEDRPASETKITEAIWAPFSLTWGYHPKSNSQLDWANQKKIQKCVIVFSIDPHSCSHYPSQSWPG